MYRSVQKTQKENPVECCIAWWIKITQLYYYHIILGPWVRNPWIPGSGVSPGEGNGNPLQYSCPENPWKEAPGRLQFMGSQESDTT